MRWCVIRHPELGAAIVGEDSLPVHEKRGWVVTSPLVYDQHSLNVAHYPLPEPAEQSASDAKSPSKPTKPTTQTSGS